MLMAHLDVVPVDASAPWQHPAFGGDIVDGEIWGRGTLDDKGCVVAICEAVERLLEQDVTPAQDVWLSFGCDEEVSGGAAPGRGRGARRRGVRPWFVLDEGGAVAHGAFPGVEPPGRRHRRHREGRDLAACSRRRAVAGMPRRRRATGRRRGSPGRSPGSRRSRSPRACPRPTRELMTQARPARAPRAAAADGQRRTAGPAAHPRAHRRRARVGRDDPDDPRGHDAHRLARAQRHRLARHRRAQHPDHGRRHRRRRPRPRAHGGRRQEDRHRGGRGQRAQPGLAVRRRRRPSTSSRPRSRPTSRTRSCRPT